MGFMFIIQTSLPNGSLWANGEISFALPYFVLSVSMSVIATGLMVWRMLSVLPKLKFARQVGKSKYALLAYVADIVWISGKQQTSPYTHISAILVESCALYAIFSLIFIVLFAINHPIQYVFLSALGNVQVNINVLSILLTLTLFSEDHRAFAHYIPRL